MKILFIQFAAIGDVLMCTPAIRVFRKSYPDAKISFIVGKNAFHTLENNYNIDNLIVVDIKGSHWNYLKFLIKIIMNHYDYVIDFQKNPRTAVISILSLAKNRISFSGKRRNFAYTNLITPPNVNVYAGIKKLTLLKPLGIENSSDFLPEMYINNADKLFAENLWKRFELEDFVIAVSPISRKSYKRWYSEGFARIFDMLIENYNAKLLFTWGPNEKHYVEEIINLMKNEVKLDYNISSIKQLHALFEKSNLFIGNDNGPRHIAMTAGISTIGIFGHPYPTHWTPPGCKNHKYIQGKIRGITNLKYEEVLVEIRSFIDELRNSKIL